MLMCATISWMIPGNAALERLLAHDERVREASRTALLSHGERRPRAIVLLHGLTASPAQFRAYSAALFERGHNVLAPLFPLHGHRDRMTEALAALTDDDLRAFALDTVEAARALGDEVTVAGFSAGGTIALWLAQRATFDRAVAIAPFLGAAAVPKFAMDVAAAFMARVPNWFVWWDPVRRDRQGPDHGYPRYPTRALVQFYRIANEAARGTREVPKARRVAIVVNRGEVSVNNAQIRALVRRWRRVGAQVEQIELRGMPPSHDIIEPKPDRNRKLPSRVFDDVLAAIDPQ